MAFLIPDNIKSRKGISAPIQRVAKALEIALDEQSTLWYEPLFDPSNQKPHFVLLIPDRGIVVLEVFESKLSGILGALRGKIRLLRDGNEIEVENPLQRADRFAKTIQDRIAGEPRLSGLGFRVAAGAILASLTEDEAKKTKLDKIVAFDKCLFKTEMDEALAGRGEAAVLRRLVGILKGNLQEKLPENAEALLRGIIQPETVIDRVGNADYSPLQLTIFRAPDGAEETIRIMDRQQEAMAKSLGDGHRVIRGVAGSGKTLVLVYRAKLMAQNFPQHRFLFACYNRSLAGELRALLADYRNITVLNLDRVMSKVINNAGITRPSYSDDDGGERMAQAALKALAAGRHNKYRGIFIDEAQDFCTDALRFALGLLEPGSDDFMIVADSAQNIYKRKFSWKSAGIQAQGRTRILRTNYRNTKEILEFASAFLSAGGDLQMDESPDPEDENAVIPPEAAIRTGVRPTLDLCPGNGQVTKMIVERVKRLLASGSGPRSIGVLYGTSQDGNAASIHRMLESGGIDVCWLNSTEAKDALFSAKNPVILSTIHSAKGLEFPRVILFSLWNERNDRSGNRKLAYVGMTRASHELYIVTTRENPLSGDLEKAISVED